jgi:hypothetical protein
MKCFRASGHILSESWMTGACAGVGEDFDSLEVLYSLLQAVIKNIRL